MLRGDLIETFQYLKGAYGKAREGHFVRECLDSIRGNGFKLDLDDLLGPLQAKPFYDSMIVHQCTQYGQQTGGAGSHCAAGKL